jgi:hypothetical protein
MKRSFSFTGAICAIRISHYSWEEDTCAPGKLPLVRRPGFVQGAAPSFNFEKLRPSSYFGSLVDMYSATFSMSAGLKVSFFGCLMVPATMPFKSVCSSASDLLP